MATSAEQILSEVERAVDAVRRSAVVAFDLGADWHQVLAAVSQGRVSAARQRQAARPKREPMGCPSEPAYRRHLAARPREKCEPCRAFMRDVEARRRAAHPEWWVRGAGQPVRDGA